MKLVQHFEKFLDDSVNLNQDRIKTLVSRVDTIERFLGNSDFVPRIIRFSAQGSWAHRTIIKPPGNKGFDADMLVFVEGIHAWTPNDYVGELRRVFRASDAYRDMTVLGNRCVTLDYANDFSLDVVPCVVGRPGGLSHFEVCNRNEGRFEPTDSEAFTRWLAERNNLITDDRLVKVIRLLKYLRDIKQTFSCKSILLTTLIGSRITQFDSPINGEMPDVPTTLKVLIGRLDDYLQRHQDLHDVTNPVLPGEHFTRHWDDARYATFREMIHKYRGWIDDAFAEGNEDKSIEKWQLVFGDDFGSGKKVITEAIKAQLVPLQVDRSHYRDAVDLVQSLGAQVLSHVKRAVPWMKVAPWSKANVAFTPSLRVTSHSSRTTPALRQVASGDVVGKRLELKFEALMPNGTSFSSTREIDIQWQVVNTDQEALQENSLRGGFYRSDKRGIRWETTKYRGIHWVEAFAIRKRDKACVGQSARFYVVIE